MERNEIVAQDKFLYLNKKLGRKIYNTFKIYIMKRLLSFFKSTKQLCFQHPSAHSGHLHTSRTWQQPPLSSLCLHQVELLFTLVHPILHLCTLSGPAALMLATHAPLCTWQQTLPVSACQPACIAPVTCHFLQLPFLLKQAGSCEKVLAL